MINIPYVDRITNGEVLFAEANEKYLFDWVIFLRHEGLLLEDAVDGSSV